MSLNFPTDWRYESPGEIPREVINTFWDMIGTIARQRDRWNTLEHFKFYFAAAAGRSSSHSSSESWAETDLDDEMRLAARNAPCFIEAFYDACKALNDESLQLPGINRINRILANHQIGYEIHPPNLTQVHTHAPIAPPERITTIHAAAHDQLRESWIAAEKLLNGGQNRQAVHEMLWLLESIATEFDGLRLDDATKIKGNYFNKIANDLRQHQRGTTLEQVLGWIKNLHGYLSSPTGGGVRHGAKLREGIGITPHDARLYCNLIRSYIVYLIGEHERLSGLPLSR